jgi:hypothetical protein
LVEAESGEPLRAKAWGRAAFERAQLHVRWTTTPDRASAVALEHRVIAALGDTDLWNRALLTLVWMGSEPVGV